ncbi:response regulator [Niveispirillum cyanobacteriorum]|uniref:DNA-binding response regulator n=1 Tax=Niveispirillum cyanobacteriorum TaxID=1612173 RepID=A0A2K9NC33_9PROT|nr:response regulator transcription factor [Niveispirillum cyanobacteriorum]AUN29725.1 DNA-binding response regulator [Niveispirillum cyanobacteriorum]GGE61364.1 DNA-binding response regulator [Niveispirillum cyanobacteriorum]
MGKVLIADDHPLVRDGLRTVVAVALDRCELFEASDLDEVIRIVDREGDFDLVLLDLNMPGNNGFAGLASLRARYPALPVVMVSAACDRQVVNEALRHGAAGFVPKSLPRGMIAKALHQVLGGDVYVPDDLEDAPAPAPSGEDQEIIRRIDTLTPQQRKVLELVVAGRLNKEIAYELDVTETTVKAHVSAILQKMRVFSRTQAVILANKVNFAPAPGTPQVSARAAAQ